MQLEIEPDVCVRNCGCALEGSVISEKRALCLGDLLKISPKWA